ncbi:MAG TPA: hypothetical protein VF167_00825 [Longimicrobiaceae bacterium]
MSVEYTTTVKLYIDGSPSEWLPCAIVYLYDRDRVSRDDFLGMEITNEYGEATFRFRAHEFVDVDDRLGGSLPELYIKVYGRDDRFMLSTRAVARRNEVPSLIRIGVSRELARDHGFL